MLDMRRKPRVFLSAEWRDLVMLNYEVERGLLKYHVPPGTELDSFDGRTYLSLVGFRFLRTKLFGVLPIPFHSNFDEINLRFYVRRRETDVERRGVVFIAEIVPKHAIASIARLAYGENYVCRPMKRRIETNEAKKAAEYQWLEKGAWSRIFAHASGVPRPAAEGSLEQFITEHYWGYTAQQNGSALEYCVDHAPWNIWTNATAGFEGEASVLYGREIAEILQRTPDSAFIADGSPVEVFRGRKLR